jgi:hypothetical protein
VRLYDGSSLSITQLDDVLLRDPSVAAYTAEIHGEAGCDCLVLTVRPAQHPIHAEPLAFELGRQAFLAELLRQGRLRLDIREGNAGHLTAGTAKRRIADRRS